MVFVGCSLSGLSFNKRIISIIYALLMFNDAIAINEPVLEPSPDQQPKWMVPLAALALSVLYLCYNYSNARKRPLPPGYRYIPHLRSWVPFVGSAIHFPRGHLRDFIRRSAKQLQAPAFTATVMGDKCLFIADSSLLNFIFRDSKQLDGLTFQKRFLKNVTGFNNAQLNVLFGQAPAKAVMNLFHKYLLKEDSLQRMIRLSQEVLLKEVSQLVVPLNSGDNQTSAIVRDDDGDCWIQQPLYEFASRAVFRASTGPLLSMNLIPDYQEHLKDLRDFENGVGLLFVGAPNFMAPACVRARGSLLSLFLSDLVCSAESPFLQERRKVLTENFGHTDEFKDDLEFTIARNNLGVFLAAVTNSIQTVFWTLFSLLQDPKGYAACAAAVRKVAAKREAGREWFTLEELDELAMLESAFLETLRMYQVLFVTREAVEDFCLNPKETDGPKYMIEKGTMIMVLPNTMHMDPEIFENPDTFQYDRFLNPNASSSSSGAKMASYLRPFGGGVHMCPGRKFIAYESRALLAMILDKYEVRLCTGETRPGIDFSRQGMSVAVPDRDVRVQIRPRTSL